MAKKNLNKNFKSELDWSPDSWFGTYRVKNENGTYYTDEDKENLDNALLKLLDIEKKAKENGTWLKNLDGTSWEGTYDKIDEDGYIKKNKDPRLWVAKKYYEKYHPEYDTDTIWYSGQAEWPTKYLYPGQEESIETNKVTRFPYYSLKGLTWWSDSPVYALYFSDKVGSNGTGSRFRRKGEENITGHVFKAYFPRNIKDSLKTQAPEKYTADEWFNMPFIFENGEIKRMEKPLTKEYSSSNGGNYYDKNNNRVDINYGVPRSLKKEAKKTDDLVNYALENGASTLYMYLVADGPGIDNKSRAVDELVTIPTNQQNLQGISIEGTSFSTTPGKRKDGTPYLYSYNETSNYANIAKSGLKLIKKKNDIRRN